ncbi:ABC1-domain-containing protein [Infundibulicybe gibba]|nr:ABC1-domain-containing protein [Infundibulicybe gibba]
MDYKLNFNAANSAGIPALHERVAERMYNLFTANGGLYIKIGQAIGANAALLPAPMQRKFACLFDDAPQIPYADVEAVLRAELGRAPTGPEGVFAEFEERSIASASVAQVHRARLWGEGEREGGKVEGKGEWVAVKVQKPDVAKQMEWDLAAYRAVMWMFEHWAFDLPVYFVVDFVSDHIRRELDFVQEAENARRTAQLVEAEPRLAGRVHIPRVYPEYSTKRVMTAEWIDGVRMSDREGVRRLMGDDAGAAPAASAMPTRAGAELRLRGGVGAVMQIMVELFSAQMFTWGWVHCDPHPGNVIVREHPTRPGAPQLVLLDHGLYVSVGEEFRRDGGVTKQWGMGMPDLLASAALMKPVRLKGHQKPGEGRERRPMTNYEQSDAKGLDFLIRSMRMVQGNNQAFNSPVNRIKITGFWASRSLAQTPNLSLLNRTKEYWHHTVFQLVMFSLDLAFWRNKCAQWVRRRLGLASEGFEDEMERSMRGFAKSNLGIDVAPGVFAG